MVEASDPTENIPKMILVADPALTAVPAQRQYLCVPVILTLGGQNILGTVPCC